MAAGRVLPGFFRLPTMAERTLYDQALTLLGFRARSIAELRRRLVQKGGTPAEIDAVIERLVEQRLLDDADFARQFTRQKLAGAGASRQRIAQELRRRGIGREVSDAAVRELVEDEGLDPTHSARRVAEKKWKALGKLDDATRRRRLYAFLARRGFNPDEIASLMREAMTAEA